MTPPPAASTLTHREQIEEMFPLSRMSVCGFKYLILSVCLSVCVEAKLLKLAFVLTCFL